MTPPLPPLPPNAALRWAVVQELLPADAVDVLEIGCGQGAVGARLARRYRYLGVEQDPDSHAVASERITRAHPTAEVVLADAGTLPTDASFDLVCAFEVIEHIEDDRGALEQWAARLRPGGTLLLSTPSSPHRYGPADTLAGHYRRYEPRALAGLLTDVGLEDPRVRSFGMPLGYLLETGRNAVAKRRLAELDGTSLEERTAGSGRHLQPRSPWLGRAVTVAVSPFALVQRAFPGRGPGLVATARRPTG